jgi:hypothetical protein
MISPADFENLFPEKPLKIRPLRRRSPNGLQLKPAPAAAPSHPWTARRR